MRGYPYIIRRMKYKYQKEKGYWSEIGPRMSSVECTLFASLVSVVCCRCGLGTSKNWLKVVKKSTMEVDFYSLFYLFFILFFLSLIYFLYFMYASVRCQW